MKKKTTSKQAVPEYIPTEGDSVVTVPISVEDYEFEYNKETKTYNMKENYSGKGTRRIPGSRSTRLADDQVAPRTGTAESCAHWNTKRNYRIWKLVADLAFAYRAGHQCGYRINTGKYCWKRARRGVYEGEF